MSTDVTDREEGKREGRKYQSGSKGRETHELNKEQSHKKKKTKN